MVDRKATIFVCMYVYFPSSIYLFAFSKESGYPTRFLLRASTCITKNNVRISKMFLPKTPEKSAQSTQSLHLDNIRSQCSFFGFGPSFRSFSSKYIITFSTVMCYHHANFLMIGHYKKHTKAKKEKKNYVRKLCVVLTFGTTQFSSSTPQFSFFWAFFVLVFRTYYVSVRLLVV
jgi:hypothetical protein